ncbi:MAG: dihydrofolate reductase [Polynucleobacter sp.]|jgi:dihydrofolate reductase|nr:dihydrofolate reductase [Polynucleobacter sp.]
MPKKIPVISMIVARSRNHVIGNNNQIPWKISADLQFFKKITMGFPIVMGRKTWESIGRPLPGRQNVVISRNPQLELKGADLASSLEDALDLLEGHEKIFLIGGQQLFEQAFPLAKELFVTEIDIEVKGDTFFEILNPDEWKEVERIQASEGDIHFEYVTLQRK